MKNEFIPNTAPWFKTKGGIAFLAIIALIIVILLSFAALVGYYAWKIKYQGEALDLAAEFQTEKFTLAGKKTSADKQTALVDTNPYIKDYNPTLGTENRPVTIVAFIDFECPFCRESFPVFQKIIKKYEPVTRIIFKHFPITALHPQSNAAAIAAACAEEQNKFWEYYNSLFITQSLGHDELIAQSKKIGLDQNKFSQCLDSNKHQNEIDLDTQDGVALGVRGTPTFFVNGYKIEGAIDEASWDKIILSQLKNK